MRFYLHLVDSRWVKMVDRRLLVYGVRDCCFRAFILIFLLVRRCGWQFIPVVHELQHNILLELLFLKELFLLVTFVFLHEDAYFGLEELLPLELRI